MVWQCPLKNDYLDYFDVQKNTLIVISPRKMIPLHSYTDFEMNNSVIPVHLKGFE